MRREAVDLKRKRRDRRRASLSVISCGRLMICPAGDPPTAGRVWIENLRIDDVQMDDVLGLR